MSRSHHYRQFPPPPEGAQVGPHLAEKIRDVVAADRYEALVIVRNDRLHWFIKGLAAGGVDGASVLEDAIGRLGKIELYVSQ